MIRYFTSRILSDKLDVNLARWKRWSREFLPPDPLGGKQSGYARQYSVADALTVYLGGLLVSHLNLSIPDSKNLLKHLLEWLSGNGLIPEQNHQAAEAADGKEHEKYAIKLVIRTDAKGGNQYVIQQILNSRVMMKTELDLSEIPSSTNATDEIYVTDEKYTETQVPMAASLNQTSSDTFVPLSEKVLHVSLVIDAFLQKLGIPLNGH